MKLTFDNLDPLVMRDIKNYGCVRRVKEIINKNVPDIVKAKIITGIIIDARKKRISRSSEWNKNNQEKCNKFQRKYELKNLDRCFKFLGGKSVKSGSTTDLEFHHIYPPDKLFDIGGSSSKSFDLLKIECYKCALLTAKEHDQIHKEINKLKLQGKLKTREDYFAHFNEFISRGN